MNTAEERRQVTPAAQQTVRVGFSLWPGDPFWVQVRESVQQRAQELDIILVPISLPDSQDPFDNNNVLSVIEDLKAHELGALITHVLPPALMRAVLNEGMPIVCSEDTTMSHPLLVSVQGLFQAAVLVAEYLAQHLQGVGRILMAGSIGDNSHTGHQRVDGFYSVISRYPQMHCYRAGVGWSYEAVLASLLERNVAWQDHFPEGRIDAIFGLSDSQALAGRDAAQALSLLSPNTLVVGINGDPLALAAIQTGRMHATVETSPEQLGANLAEYARLAALREPQPEHFPYALELVTVENLQQVAMRKLLAFAPIPSRLVNVNYKLEQQRLVQMKTSLELNHRVGSILDQDELLAEMADIIRARYEYEHAQLFVWSNSERALVRVQEKRMDAADQLAIPLSQSGALGHALLHNQIVYIPDVLNSKRFLRDARWPDIQSRVILPVHVGGRIVGVLDLHSQHRTLRNQAELDALQTLADELGTAMRNAQLYAQAIQARAEAVQADLQRTRLLAHVSHQLRTPLNIILGYCQSALAAATNKSPAPTDQLVEDLRYIERSGFDLQRLIDDLLDLAQVETGVLQLHKESIAPTEFMAEVFGAAMHTLSIGGHVRWRLQAPSQLPLIQADPMRLRNTLMNLLDNAAKYTEHGQIVLGVEDSGGRLHIWVEDTGCGIAAEALLNIRSNMQHGLGRAAGADGRAGGAVQTGLGLIVGYRIVAMHGGELQLDSVAGQGTTGHIYLPYSQAKAETAVTKRREEDTRRARSLLQEHSSEQLVKKTQDYIANHFAREITREDIADTLGVSPAYVSRVFRRHTGMALWDYVTSFRIARARELLQHSDMTITEIAFATGFNEPAYFSRMFRKVTGKPPKEFRGPH
jgi:signal transduction histidine kinase/AraC-like DNA-binding protein